MATHYQVLGVHNKADSAAIRSAYLTLIKRHHPDSGASGASQVRITDINLAYSVLRDTRKRAQYDAQLLRQSMRSQPVAPRRYLPPARWYSPWRRRGLLALRIGAIAAAILILAIPGDRIIDTPGPRQEKGMQASAPVPASPPISSNRFKTPGASELDSGIEEAVAIALAVPLDDAGEASMRCFEEAGREPDGKAADRCVAFDLAISYWQDGGFGEVDDLHYFEPSAMKRRHRQSLVMHDPLNADGRLRALEYVTMAALVDALKAQQVEPLPAPSGGEGGSAVEAQKMMIASPGRY